MTTGYQFSLESGHGPDGPTRPVARPGPPSQAARFLFALAFLKLRQHDAIRERAGLAPSDRSQFRARCFRQASTRISAAMAKATVLRLTGTSSLPSPTYLPHHFCASNGPGPADLHP